MAGVRLTKKDDAMNDYKLLIDLHKQGYLQGPGGDAETEQALNLAMIDRAAPLKVADIGCGTGASAVLLARLLNARITAVDFLQDFLDVLNERAESAGVPDRIPTLACLMDNLPFANEELDVIWSEGAIYNIGFEKGVAEWRRFLKAGGCWSFPRSHGSRTLDQRNSRNTGIASIPKSMWLRQKSGL